MQNLMLIAGLGILCWVIMRSRTRGKRRSSPAVITPHLQLNSNAIGQPEQFSGTRSLGAPSEVLKWQVELHDLGRDIKAELDSKLIAVRTLTQQYDLAAKRLGDLIQLADAHVPEADANDRCKLAASRLRVAGWTETQISDLLSLESAASNSFPSPADS